MIEYVLVMVWPTDKVFRVKVSCVPTKIGKTIENYLRRDYSFYILFLTRHMCLAPQILKVKISPYIYAWAPCVCKSLEVMAGADWHLPKVIWCPL